MFADSELWVHDKPHISGEAWCAVLILDEYEDMDVSFSEFLTCDFLSEGQQSFQLSANQEILQQ